MWREVASTSGRTAGARRARTGRRVGGTEYAPAVRADAGVGGRWPHRHYSAVEPATLREAYEWWRVICRDIASRRWARAWEQTDLGEAAGIAVNTVQRLKRGEGVAAHHLLMVCSALGMEIEQPVDVADVRARPFPTGRPAAASPGPQPPTGYSPSGW